MADYPAEAFPFVCPECDARQPVTRREAIDLGDTYPVQPMRQSLRYRNGTAGHSPRRCRNS